MTMSTGRTTRKRTGRPADHTTLELARRSRAAHYVAVLAVVTCVFTGTGREPHVVQYFAMVLDMLRNREDEGQGLVEYGLIIALVAVVCIAALTALGGSISGILDTISGAI
jgi:pilus assembly protein Flp/PilA